MPPLFAKPQLSSLTSKKKEDIPKNLYEKCPLTGEMVFVNELRENLWVVPASGYHFPIDARERIAALFDTGSFEETDKDLGPVDALSFCDSKPYSARIVEYQKKTGERDAVVCGLGKINGNPVSIAVMDFRFMAASMGAVVGEKITRAIERATELKIPVIIVSSSGGARMQEGGYSLMQMAKTSAALGKHSEKGLPFVSILTHPTTGGVTASFAVLGDINIAEPGALIGFAGPRVIKETIRKDLPEGFQTAEFLVERGLIDIIVPRKDMRKKLTQLLSALLRGEAPAEKP